MKKHISSMCGLLNVMGPRGHGIDRDRARSNKKRKKMPNTHGRRFGRDRSPIIWSGACGGDTIDAVLKFLLIVRICVHIV